MANPFLKDVKNQYVINDSDSDFKKLIELISNKVNSNIIQIDWKDKKRDLEKLFKSDIKNCPDINTIQYEKILLEVVYEIIILHETNVLRNIMEDKNIKNKTEECYKLLEGVKNFTDQITCNTYYEKPIY